MTLASRGLAFPTTPRRRRARVQALLGDESEMSFMRRVLDLLKLCGWDFLYHVWDPTNAPGGFPDVIALRAGRGLALECKSQHGRVRARQREWVEAFNAIPGFVGAIVRPSDWPWIVRVAR